MEKKENSALRKAESVMDNGKNQRTSEKAHKKAEKQKAKAARIREKNRRKQEKLERKERQRQDVAARKEMHNSGESSKKSKCKDKEKKGYIAAIISLSIATLVLASVLTCTFLIPSANDTELEASYNRAFYDTVEQVDNIDLNLSKALSTKDTGALQKYLVDTAINSELAEGDLQTLPLQDESKFYTTKLVNQIGDYAKYLNNKIIDGQSLNASDYAGLNQLYEANVSLKNALSKMIKEMGADYSFKEMAGGGKDMVVDSFNELQNLSVEYPELIYDGPFSDGADEREIKGLSGREITSAEAVEIFKQTFKDYGVKEVESLGESNRNISCFNVQGKIKDDMIYAEISKTGGKIIMFDYAGKCEDVKFDRNYAEEKAMKFIEKLGATDMKAVWMNLENNVYTFNFAYEQNGVICYGDLIKVRVCADSGDVLGLEASSYYANHTVRTISAPTLSVSDAMEKVADNIEINTSRLAVIPIGTKSEKLCYEFSGEHSGQTYYVYIGAMSGKQVEMFKVVQSTEGELLM